MEVIRDPAMGGGLFLPKDSSDDDDEFRCIGVGVVGAVVSVSAVSISCLVVVNGCSFLNWNEINLILFIL